jgi:hypothetical protein
MQLDARHVARAECGLQVAEMLLDALQHGLELVVGDGDARGGRKSH